MRKRTRSSVCTGRLGYQQLECRKLLATFLVDTQLDVVSPDDGVLSLREALTAANLNAAFSDAPAGDTNGDRITFPDSFDGSILELSQGELEITDDVIIGGANAAVTISGNQQNRIFNIDSSERVVLSALELVRGHSLEGGAIRLSGGGRLVASGVTFEDNSSTGDEGGRGGAIYNVDGNLAIGRSRFANNEASAGGGAIFSEGGRVIVFQSSFEGNEAHQGGAFVGQTGQYIFNGSTFDGNNALRDGGALLFTDNSATVIIVSSDFLHNEVSDGSGGAIASRTSDSLYVFGDSNFSENKSHVAGLERSDMRQSGAGGAIDAEGLLRIGGAYFRENSAGEVGGAITASGSRLAINNTTFSRNSALKAGGAIVSVATRNVFFNSLFSRNQTTVETVDEDFSGLGGAVVLAQGTDRETPSATFRNLEFSYNRSLHSGGAIVAIATKLDIFDTTINDSFLSFEQDDSLRGGAGMLLLESEVTVSRSTFEENKTNGLGGAIFSVEGTLSVRDSQVVDNESGSSGGGIAVAGGNAVLVENRFEGNLTQGLGGAVVTVSPDLTNPDLNTELTIRGGSILFNRAGIHGGGIFVGENTEVTLVPKGEGVDDGLILSTNIANQYGGGIASFGQLHVRDIEIRFNEARIGAGIFVDHPAEASATLTGNDFVYNRAGEVGGAVFVGPRSRDTFFETMSNFQSNQPSDQPDIFFG